MPRRKKTDLQKQKIRLITTRLMKISLQVDNYIYKHMSIPESEADGLIKEVASYTDQCSGDDRSLQVIEKLIHQLKSIIQEQQEINDNNSDINGLRATSLPANSIADEDLTQCHDNEVNNILVSLGKKIKPTSINRNKRKLNYYMADKDLRENSLGKGVIEENGNSYDKLFPEQDKIKEPITINDDAVTFLDDGLLENIDLCTFFQKSFSNLSIEDIDGEIHFDKEVNSQSVLTNFECEEFKEKEANTIAGANTIANNIKNREAAKQKEITAQLRNYRKGNPTNFGLNNNNSRIDIDKTPTKVTEGRKPRNKFTAPTIKQVTENLIQNSIKNNGTIKRKYNKRDGTATETSVKKTKQNIKLNTDKAYTRNESKKKNSKNEQNEKLTYKNITKIDESSKAKPNSAKAAKRAKTINKNNNLTEITNICVEMDLSWIENIKYVREVALDEIYPVKYDDKFWQNYHLPADWNDGDFL